jgi:hypothetical protein
MGTDQLMLGLGVVAMLIAWRRRLPVDFVGRVKADAALAMLRALLVLLAGLALALGTGVANMLCCAQRTLNQVNAPTAPGACWAGWCVPCMGASIGRQAC